ncbi:MAG: glycine oxidase ThiO [Mycobacteriaceae bacterium]
MPAQGAGGRVQTLSVVGAGAVGLSVGWRAAQAGWDVTVHDPAAARGASWVAGGMLAPLTEGWPGEESSLDLGLSSLRRWPVFADELGVALMTAGTVVLGVDGADADELDNLAGWLAERGRDVTRLTRRELRSREPSLAGVRAALEVPGDWSVDNRELLAALQARVPVSPDPVHSLDDLDTDQVVVCAGAATAALLPGLPVRAVKGEILRLRVRPGALPPPTRTVRAVVHGRHVYLVPRVGGLVVGATTLEVGVDREVTLGGVRDLAADAETVLPAVAEYGVISVDAGLRPGTPDNVPLIGRVDERTVVAAGHGRNGLLLSPLTADAVLAELNGSPLEEAAAARPGRFT